MKKEKTKLHITVKEVESGEVLLDQTDATSFTMGLKTEEHGDMIMSVAGGSTIDVLKHLASNFEQTMKFLADIVDGAPNDEVREEIISTTFSEMTAQAFSPGSVDIMLRILNTYAQAKKKNGHEFREEEMKKLIESISFFQVAAVSVEELENRLGVELPHPSKKLKMTVLDEEENK